MMSGGNESYTNNNVVNRYIENVINPLMQRIDNAKINRNINELGKINQEINEILEDNKYDVRFLDVCETLKKENENIINYITALYTHPKETINPNNVKKMQAETIIENISSKKPLNSQGRTRPRIFSQSDISQITLSPYNRLLLALHAAKQGYATAWYITGDDAIKSGNNIRLSEMNKGLPIKTNVNGEEKIIMLYNLAQTTLPIKRSKLYNKIIDEHGVINNKELFHSNPLKDIDEIMDNKLKIVESLKLQYGIKFNSEDQTYYDDILDNIVVGLRHENACSTIKDYYKAMAEAIAAPERLGLTENLPDNIVNGKQKYNYMKLVTDLASVIKTNDLGYPASFATHNMTFLSIKKQDPDFLDKLEKDVNNTVDVIDRAERGEKIDYSIYKEPSVSKNMAKEEIAISPEIVEKITNVIAYHTDDDKYFVLPTINGVDNIQPKEISLNEWKNIISSQNAQDYKRNLAASLYKDVFEKESEDKRYLSPDEIERFYIDNKINLRLKVKLNDENVLTGIYDKNLNAVIFGHYDGKNFNIEQFSKYNRNLTAKEFFDRATKDCQRLVDAGELIPFVVRKDINNKINNIYKDGIIDCDFAISEKAILKAAYDKDTNSIDIFCVYDNKDNGNTIIDIASTNYNIHNSVEENINRLSEHIHSEKFTDKLVKKLSFFFDDFQVISDGKDFRINYDAETNIITFIDSDDNDHFYGREYNLENDLLENINYFREEFRSELLENESEDEVESQAADIDIDSDGELDYSEYHEETRSRGFRR